MTKALVKNVENKSLLLTDVDWLKENKLRVVKRGVGSAHDRECLQPRLGAARSHRRLVNRRPCP